MAKPQKGTEHSIRYLKNNVSKLGGFARSNLFAVTVYLGSRTFDYGASSGPDKTKRTKYLKLLARSVVLPGSQLATVDVPYRGMAYKIPGERIYEPLTCTFMNDSNQTIRNTFLDWHRTIRDFDNNYMFNDDDNNVYNFGDVKVDMLHRDKWNGSRNAPQISNSFYFDRAWLAMVGSLELDSGSNDQIQEFTVQFEYQRYRLTEREDYR